MDNQDNIPKANEIDKERKSIVVFKKQEDKCNAMGNQLNRPFNEKELHEDQTEDRPQGYAVVQDAREGYTGGNQSSNLAL